MDAPTRLFILLNRVVRDTFMCSTIMSTPSMVLLRFSRINRFSLSTNCSSAALNVWSSDIAVKNDVAYCRLISKRFLSWLLIILYSSLESNGLGRNESAPILYPISWFLGSLRDVSRMTGILLSSKSVLMVLQSSNPFIRGIMMSLTTTLGIRWRMISKASFPSCAV